MDTRVFGPDEALREARTVLSPQEIRVLVREAYKAAIEGGDPASRKFLQELYFPKDTSKVEDLRFKRIVVCSFEQYNEVRKLKEEIERITRIADEHAETIVRLRAELKEQDEQIRRLLEDAATQRAAKFDPVDDAEADSEDDTARPTLQEPEDFDEPCDDEELDLE